MQVSMCQCVSVCVCTCVCMYVGVCVCVCVFYYVSVASEMSKSCCPLFSNNQNTHLPCSWLNHHQTYFDLFSILENSVPFGCPDITVLVDWA